MSTKPLVLAFDVFGTVVDWRSSIAREAAPFLAALGRADIDPHLFADQWRGLYQPAMEECRSGRRPYTRLDILNRETLEALLVRHDIDRATIDDQTLTDFAHAWRRLDPWPDAVAGLTRLKVRFPIVTLSNGNTALTLEMARRAGLPWDTILGAESTGYYKPLPQAYLGTAEILGIAPSELCLVAAHHSDLAAARACGLITAFVHRPLEYGGRRAPDADAAQDWDYQASSFIDLTMKLEG
ncbi:haloacid dehalogenase type II [Sphingomonas sp. So64.6b]|uniref:haloacid dehalogenase type II n=1 Tax=Sphingomonas sp. So64.6b TaxID=2997354 RepID=UPI001602790F|nr:haloacid dehalogenase type II [Sphingomonas sp. So64.6b]QNA84864.1 haloacid dehalogenase type II [Sphingomonas sp. So64.6b]